MERKLYETKIQTGLEETSKIREELRHLMTAETKLEYLRNYFVLRGVDTTKVNIILNQVFKDRDERMKLIVAAKKRTALSILFLFLFAAGVTGWFYVWSDWITYFTGINLVLSLFFLQQALSLKGKARIYE